jgi:hypothetical protein
MVETLELKSLLRKSLAAGKSPSSPDIVLYASFGVVKGRTTLAGTQQTDGNLTQTEILELVDVTVEHYSSHLPTASFDQLYIRLSDIRAFAFAISHSGSRLAPRRACTRCRRPREH